MKLTRNIYRHELACKCNNCNCETMDWQTIEIVQDVCDHFSKILRRKAYVSIHSAHRCNFWNAHEGGAENSYHVRGQAIDFSISGFQAKEVYDYLDDKYPATLGLGLYEGFVHVDPRTKKARW